MRHNLDSYLQQLIKRRNTHPYIYNEKEVQNGIDPNNDNNYMSIEYLLSIPQIINDDKDNEKELKTNFSLTDFVKSNFNNLKEDLIYYFSSPESLSHFRSSLEEEISYEFYKDIDFQKFITIQKERFRLIISNSNLDINTQMKISKLSNFNSSLCSKTSSIQNNNKINQKLNNANIIGIKLDECSNLYSEQEINEDKIINYLNELKGVFILNNIDMESLGFILFNFIEKNLISVLKLIESKLILKKSIKNLTNFSIICLDILKSFKSSKLFFYIIQFLKKNNDILDLTQLNLNKEIIQFIPNNCFDFNQLDKNIQKVLIKDLKKPLIDKGIIKEYIKINFFNEIKEYRTLNYDKYLLFFWSITSQKNEKSKEYELFYYKIDLINPNIIDIGCILLLNEKECDTIIIRDINITIKNEFIYIFYIIENYGNYSLKYKIYNKYSITLIIEGEIILKENFIPIALFNDNKYLYCISKTNQIFVIKRNNKLNNKKYITCSFRRFENDLLYYSELSELSTYEMYNSLYINNLFFLNNKNHNSKYIAKLINKNENYILNIYEIEENSEESNQIKIAYNDNKFVITKIINDSLLYDMTSENFNNLMDKGILLLPFNSNIVNNNYSENIYEYLIQEYSSFINLCGNFELINAEKEKNLIKYPFSFCFNFDQNILNFLIDTIIENTNFDWNKLNFIIILKQVVCSLYNAEVLKEEKVKKIIPYFKTLILNSINSNEKVFNKILNEIIEISSYIKNNTIIEFDEINCMFNKANNNINLKSKLLLMEFLFKQNKMKKTKELYEYIIQLEKDYLLDIFKNESFNLSCYNIFKKLMINASETFYKEIKNIQNLNIISLISFLLENIQILMEFYNKKINNIRKNLEEISFLYNSFNFRSFFFLIEYLMANKIILRNKEYIIQMYKTLLIIDKNRFDYNDLLDKNNIIEITNYSLLNDDRENTEIINNIMKDSIKINIKLKEKKDIIIKTSLLSNKDFQEIENSIKIRIISDQVNYPIQLPNGKIYFYKNISEINVEFKTRNENKNNFIINIIPVKNNELLGFLKAKKDHKIIISIEKCIIHYLLFLFEDIKSQIEEYNNNKIVKNLRKIFQSEIFKFLSIPIEKLIISNFISSSPFNEISNQLIENLNKNIDNIQTFFSLNNELLANFNKINEGIYQNKLDFQKIYEDKIKNNYVKNPQNMNILNEKKYKKLFEIFNYDLSKKPFMAMQMSKDENINSLINKIFLFGIKYYNIYQNLDTLLKEVEKFEDNEEIKKNINEIQLLDNYSLFFSFYKESYKIKNIYQNHRNNFDDSKFDEENKKYFEDNFKKIEFLYNNIIPNDDFTIRPNTLIIKNLIDLIDNSGIGIYEITQYSFIQNFSVQIKLNHRNKNILDLLQRKKR